MRALTLKQQRYLDALLDPKTESNVAAYRHAYSCSRMTAAAVYEESRRMRRHPLITLAFDKAMDRREREMTRNAASMKRYIVERLTKEAESAESDSARVRALELLGKVASVALFADTLITENRTPESESELLDELRERLGNLLPPEQDEPVVVESDPDGGDTIH